MIGGRCKARKGFSRAVLISRRTIPLKHEDVVARLRDADDLEKTIFADHAPRRRTTESDSGCGAAKKRRVLVILPRWPHPFPSRTRQLSSVGPMILGANSRLGK